MQIHKRQGEVLGLSVPQAFDRRLVVVIPNLLQIHESGLVLLQERQEDEDGVNWGAHEQSTILDHSLVKEPEVR